MKKKFKKNSLKHGTGECEMICYKCDRCGDISDSLGTRTDIYFKHAGTASVNYKHGGYYQVCNECRSKIEAFILNEANE